MYGSRARQRQPVAEMMGGAQARRSIASHEGIDIRSVEAREEAFVPAQEVLRGSGSRLTYALIDKARGESALVRGRQQAGQLGRECGMHPGRSCLWSMKLGQMKSWQRVAKDDLLRSAVHRDQQTKPYCQRQASVESRRKK